MDEEERADNPLYLKNSMLAMKASLLNAKTQIYCVTVAIYRRVEVSSIK